jgi:hypothetical protein
VRAQLKALHQVPSSSLPCFLRHQIRRCPSEMRFTSHDANPAVATAACCNRRRYKERPSAQDVVASIADSSKRKQPCGEQSPRSSPSGYSRAWKGPLADNQARRPATRKRTLIKQGATTVKWPLPVGGFRRVRRVNLAIPVSFLWRGCELKLHPAGRPRSKHLRSSLPSSSQIT